MPEPQVSIITPCYNGGKYIEETILSVRAQTFPDWEMIVIDDGSKDNSMEIVTRYTKEDRRIRLLAQSNQGSAAARNRGIRAAKGRYIALLDADDIWCPEFLEKQIGFMKEHEAVCVCCSYTRINEQSEEILQEVVPKAEITVKDMRIMNQIGCLTGLYDSQKHGKVYLKEELKSLRDDYAYWYDIVCLEGVAYGNPEVLAKYRVLGNSTTGNKRKLIGKQFEFYRRYLKESTPEALLNTIRWGAAGLKKFSK